MKRCLSFLVLAASIAGSRPASAEQFPIHGFVQGASSYRLIQPDGCPPTQRLACEESFILGEGRVRLELAPRGEWWGLNTKTELIYDAVGREVNVSLREGYLDLNFPALDLRIGRQIITWGVGDLIFINDVFPKDWVAFISGLPLEYLKKGSDAVSATAHWAGASLQLVVAPHFVADTVPEAGGRLSFYDPAGSIETRTTDDPPASIENLELGLRAFRNLFGWDVSLYAYRGFSHTPTEEVEPGPALRLFYPPLNVYGASAQGAALGGVVSFEAGYYDSRSDRSGRNPAVENSSTRLLAGYQREVVPDLTVSGQYYVQVMQNYGAYLQTRSPAMPACCAARHVLTLRLTQLLLHQTLRLGLFVLGSPNEGDWYVNPEASYQVTDAISASLGFNFFGGPPWSPYGQFKGDSNVHAVLRYAF